MFQGVYTALITPFDEQFKVDYEGLLSILQIQQQVDGIVVFGTTGEGMTLTMQEKIDIIKFIKQHTDLTIIMGTGSNCTRTTIEQSLIAEQLKVDGIMVVTPYYNKPSSEGLFHHYKSISESINLPIILYNIPSRSGIDIDDTTLLRLMQCNNIVAIKDSDYLRPLRIYNRQSCKENFTFLAGDDYNILANYIHGGQGVVSVASNLFPDKLMAIYQALEHNDIDQARQLQIKLFNLYEILFCEVNPVPIKYAVYKRGLIKTPLVRPPLYSLINTKKVDDILKLYID